MIRSERGEARIPRHGLEESEVLGSEDNACIGQGA